MFPSSGQTPNSPPERGGGRRLTTRVRAKHKADLSNNMQLDHFPEERDIMLLACI